MQKHYGLLHIPDVTLAETALPAWYRATEVDDVLRRQASAALSGMDAAKRISSAQLQQAHRLRAESSPEALESERRANAILTDRVSALENSLREAMLENAALRAELDSYADLDASSGLS